MRNKRRYLYLLICLILCTFVLSACSQEEPLNDDAEPLTIEDVWTEEDKFSIWIDSVTEIPVADAEEYAKNDYLPKTLDDTEGKRYYDISFSYQNINHPGYREHDKVFEGAMCVCPAVFGEDAQGEMVVSSVYCIADDGGWLTTATIDGEEVPVTKGITSSDNHLVVEVDETAEKLTNLDIVFFVPTPETQSIENGPLYKRSFLYPLK